MTLSPLETWALLVTACTVAAVLAVRLARRLEDHPDRRPADVDLVGPPRRHPEEHVRILPPDA